MTKDMNRRDVLQGAALGAAAVGTLAAGTFAATKATAQTSGGGNHRLIASCWVHMGPVVPFAGRMWSPIPFKYRAEQVAAAGFQGMGLFHDDLAYILEREAPGSTNADKFRWMKGILDENGLDTNEIEFLTQWMHDPSDARRQGEQPIRELLIEAANILQPTNLKCGNLGNPVSVEEANRNFRALCADFEASDVNVCMEILPPDPNGQTIDQAMAVTDGPDNGGIFLDTWHVNNIAGISYEDIAALQPGDIKGIELDDGWLTNDERYAQFFQRIGSPGFIELTVNTRRPLGEGNFDVIGFIKAVKDSGYDGPWGNEILSEELRRFPMEVAVRHVHETSINHVRHAIDGTELAGPVSLYNRG
ncbi:sugar phosphate isomerase/epimerase family protein [Roseobacter weihaiensis]|uniref:sugar phosphate isomerase/epimerase family protein n=1 Tax=Roseobacter weihaiensis TaxID=2763262 RepID=UPI001D0BA111|nr:TIM barrel protein [Roseobacter sp. H9]